MTFYTQSYTGRSLWTLKQDNPVQKEGEKQFKHSEKNGTHNYADIISFSQLNCNL